METGALLRLYIPSRTNTEIQKETTRLICLDLDLIIQSYAYKKIPVTFQFI